jgi:hypothetical protein
MWLVAILAAFGGGFAVIAAGSEPGSKPQAPAKMEFRHHFIDTEIPGRSWGQTALADVDRDGDLDFITGQDRSDIFWYEYQDADHWTRHLLGRESPSEVGGVALDVDGDGWVDFVAGGAWYRNPRTPRTTAFEKHVFGDVPRVHDVVAADVNGDGKPEIITMSDQNNVRWYEIAKEPTQTWERHDVGPSVHAGLSAGDIDGDGDVDILRSNVWFENGSGDGLKWAEHPTAACGGTSGWQASATRSAVCDINRDGRNDVVLADAETAGAKIVWLENLDGRGRSWKRHELPHGDSDARGAYHSLAVRDFDGDGDLDIFSCEMEGVPGARQPRWFVWENVDGKGAEFRERVILDARLGGHEAVVGDVDGDGDLDVCSKLWAPRPDNANRGRNHADFLENLCLSRKPRAAAPKTGATTPAGGSQ